MNKSIALLIAAALAAPAYASNEFATTWQQPFAIEMPAPVRNIVLRRDVDAQDFIRKSNLVDARLMPQGRQTIVQVAMSEAEWQRAQTDVCQSSEVALCEAMLCQAIQLDGTVDDGQAKARIVRNAPEQVPQEQPGEAGMCNGPPLVPPLAPGEAGLTDLNLNLDLRERDTTAEGGAQTTTEQITRDTATGPSSSTGSPPADETRNSFEFDLSARAGAMGGRQLNADRLPTDTTGYSLVVAQGCNTVSVPLDSLVPARVPGLITVIITQGTATDVANTHALTLVSEAPLTSTSETIATLATTDNIFQTIYVLRFDARVRAVQEEFIYRTSAIAGYSDTYEQFTYGPKATRARELHRATSGAGQTIAVIDTGVALEHPELQGRVESLDVSNKGWSADAHGTAVTGIIAAAANNAQGSYGVAPLANILAIKACQPNQVGGLEARCWTSTLVRALDAAMTRDARIINMSLAGPPDELVAEFVQKALDQDRLIVAGAGNGGPEANPAFPAALEGVLAVSAVDANNSHFRQANVGAYIDVVAPGVDIVAPSPEGNYPPLSGTSMATAHVTGMAALLSDLVPLMNADQVGSIIALHTTDLGEPGTDPQYGAGLVNACTAAAEATADPAICETDQGGSNEIR